MEFYSISSISGSTLSTEGLPINWDLYTPISNTNHEVPVIIFLHGFKGFKDWGVFPDACCELAKSGFGVLAMNFSLNGVAKNFNTYEHLELFERETLTQDLADIASVIEDLQEGSIKNSHAQLNTDIIGLIGHSRGGHTAVVAAAEFEAVQSLVTWSAVADFRTLWSDKMIADWEKKGFAEIINKRTNQTMRIGKVVYEDTVKNADRVIALNRAKDVRIPSLFIHAREDESVPYTDSERLYIECAAKDKELRFIANTGHTFGCSHPFTEEDFPRPFTEVLEWTKGWFREYLKS